MANTSTIRVEVVQTIRLNDFVHVFIQRNGLAYVVDNYQPIREKYYENKYKQQQSLSWEESQSNA